MGVTHQDQKLGRTRLKEYQPQPPSQLPMGYDESRQRESEVESQRKKTSLCKNHGVEVANLIGRGTQVLRNLFAERRQIEEVQRWVTMFGQQETGMARESWQKEGTLMQIPKHEDKVRLHGEITHIKTHHGQQAYTHTQTCLYTGTRVSLDTQTLNMET